MNPRPNPAQFALPAAREIDSLQAERAVIGQCMVRPAKIEEVAGRLCEIDFSHPVNGSIAGAMMRLHDEGRVASLETLVATLGDGEIEPGLTVREYLFGIANDALNGLTLPIEDAIGVVLDWSRRNAATRIGSSFTLSAMSPGISLQDALGELVERADDLLASMRSGKAQAYDLAEAGTRALAHFKGDTPSFPTTGLADFDRMIGGWPRGELSVLAGRPGMGKTAAAVCSILKSAKAGHASLFLSLEMTAEQLGARLLTDMAYQHRQPIYYEDIVNKNHASIGEPEMRRLQDAHRLLKTLPVAVEQKFGMTMSEVTARARKAAAALDRQGKKLELIFVDHMLLIAASNRYAGSRNNEVREYAEGLKALASELDVSMVALCQLNRGVEGRENKRPGLADIKESGAVEEIASTITFLFRPAYYLQKRDDDPERDKQRQDLLRELQFTLEYDVAKNRNGRTGVIDAFADIGANAIRNKSFAR